MPPAECVCVCEREREDGGEGWNNEKDWEARQERREHGGDRSC